MSTIAFVALGVLATKSPHLTFVRTDGIGSSSLFAVRYRVSSKMGGPVWVKSTPYQVGVKAGSRKIDAAVAPDGKAVAFVCEDKLYLAPARLTPTGLFGARGTALANLACDAARNRDGTWTGATQVAETVARPDWSPDGRRLTYVKVVNPATRMGDVAIRSVNADLSVGPETKLTNLTGRAHDDAAPRFSPDGSRIVFVRDLIGNKIFTMRTDGTDIRCENPGGEAPGSGDWGMTSWTPSGGFVASCLSVDLTKLGLWIFGPGGSGARRIDSTGMQSNAAVTSDESTLFYIQPVRLGTTDFYHLFSRRFDGTGTSDSITDPRHGISDSQPRIVVLPATVRR